MTIEERIVKLRKAKDFKDDLNDHLTKTKNEIAHEEGQLIKAMQVEGMDGAKVEGVGSVSINTSQKPNIKDWDAVLDFVLDGNRHLLKKEIKGAAYRDMLESGIEVPGVEPFEKVTLNFRR